MLFKVRVVRYLRVGSVAFGLCGGSHPLKKFQKLLRRLAPLMFFICFQAFRDPIQGELPHVQIFMKDGTTPLT